MSPPKPAQAPSMGTSLPPRVPESPPPARPPAASPPRPPAPAVEGDPLASLPRLSRFEDDWEETPPPRSSAPDPEPTYRPAAAPERRPTPTPQYVGRRRSAPQPTAQPFGSNGTRSANGTYGSPGANGGWLGNGASSINGNGGHDYGANGSNGAQRPPSSPGSAGTNGDRGRTGASYDQPADQARPAGGRRRRGDSNSDVDDVLARLLGR
jgi:hypothetical protein